VSKTTPSAPTKSQAGPVGGLGLLLDRVTSSLVKDFEAALAPWDLRNLHLAILSTVSQFGPLPQIRIGEYLGIERQTMANLIDDLERRGLVERQRATDRRVWAIAITTEGDHKRREAANAGAAHAHEVFSGLTEQDRADLMRVLLKLSTGGHYPNLFVAPVS
jgi:DNA-binding MarR family transcriptional regulator